MTSSSTQSTNTHTCMQNTHTCRIKYFHIVLKKHCVLQIPFYNTKCKYTLILQCTKGQKDSSEVVSAGFSSEDLSFDSQHPFRWLTVTCKFSSRRYHALSWPPQTLHLHNIHSHKPYVHIKIITTTQNIKNIPSIPPVTNQFHSIPCREGIIVPICKHGCGSAKKGTSQGHLMTARMLNCHLSSATTGFNL